MKKLLGFITFFTKASLLIFLLIFGWAFINVANLFKGKKTADHDEDLKSIFGIDDVSADAPGGSASTPFLAYFDGHNYVLENDILFGKPTSFFAVYEEGKKVFEDGKIRPDLYKITAPLGMYEQKNTLRLQIQEIEPEESYFKKLTLKRITHPKNTEVIVDSQFRSFYVVDKDDFEKNLVLPAMVKSMDGKINFTSQNIGNKKYIWNTDTNAHDDIHFATGESVELSFSGLSKNMPAFLTVKAWYRDWTAGLLEEWKRNESPVRFRMITGNFARALIFVPIFLVGYFQHKLSIDSSALLLPLLGGMCPNIHSLVYQYKTTEGKYKTFSICGQRGWKYNLELIELPEAAITKDGNARLRIISTKRHVLGFVGIAQNFTAVNEKISEEHLPLRKAHHNRLKKDVTPILKEGKEGYVHTIPGDTVDLEFSASQEKNSKHQKETYLIQSSGFYTALSPESRKLAGNWREKISPEAKERLATLVPLKNYK